jgi:excisionase family DNA binding protein
MAAQFYSVAEAARVLGVSEGALRQRIRRGQIPITKFGGSILIPRAEFDRLINTLLAASRRL